MENYSKYNDEVPMDEVAQCYEKPMYKETFCNFNDKVTVIIPDYPSKYNDLTVLIKNGSKTDKYLIDLTNNRYHELLLDILGKYNLGNSKIMQLGVFNKIQNNIVDYYVDIINQSCVYYESSENSLLYCVCINLFEKNEDSINVCVIDEDKLIESYKRRITKQTQKDFFDQNFIYLMKNKRTKLFKIGFSKMPIYRERTLQSEEPEIYLVKKWVASQKYESKLKKQFSSKRKRGEWFALDDDDLMAIDNLMSKFYNSKEEALTGLVLKISNSCWFNKKENND